MRSPETLPFTKLVDVSRLPDAGTTVRIVASPEECAAIARDFKLPAVHSLEGEYRLKGDHHRVSVTGKVRGRVSQTCVVTLDPFEAEVVEEVDVDFSEAGSGPPVPEGEAAEIDPPDEIVNGKVDLGALTAEFLALGLDPYPRKPGVTFDAEAHGASASPFAALKGLKGE